MPPKKKKPSILDNLGTEISEAKENSLLPQVVQDLTQVNWYEFCFFLSFQFRFFFPNGN